jgi:surface polysaccharide O-acyltransferase-like enzyme
MQSRNLNLDILKLFLSFFVVVAHLMPYSYENEFQNNIAYLSHAVARVTVPLFLLISGYFLRNKLNDFEKVKKLIFRIAKLFLVWQIIYLPIILIFFNNGLITPNIFFRDLIYGFGHIWYLNAFFLGCILVYLTRNFKNLNKFILAVLLLLSGYLIQITIELKLINNVNYINFHNIIGTSRNFLFFAFPYLLLGTLLDEIKILNLKTGILISGVLLIIETYIYKYFQIPISNIYLASFPLSIYILKAILKSESRIKIKINFNLAFGIYLIHFYPLFYISKSYPSTSIDMVFIKILAVYSASIFIFYILNKLDTKLKILF